MIATFDTAVFAVNTAPKYSMLYLLYLAGGYIVPPQIQQQHFRHSCVQQRRSAHSRTDLNRIATLTTAAREMEGE